MESKNLEELGPVQKRIWGTRSTGPIVSEGIWAIGQVPDKSWWFKGLKRTGSQREAFRQIGMEATGDDLDWIVMWCLWGRSTLPSSETAVVPGQPAWEAG